MTLGVTSRRVKQDPRHVHRRPVVNGPFHPDDPPPCLLPDFPDGPAITRERIKQFTETYADKLQLDGAEEQEQRQGQKEEEEEQQQQQEEEEEWPFDHL